MGRHRQLLLNISTLERLGPKDRRLLDEWSHQLVSVESWSGAGGIHLYSMPVSFSVRMPDFRLHSLRQGFLPCLHARDLSSLRKHLVTLHTLQNIYTWEESLGTEGHFKAECTFFGRLELARRAFLLLLKLQNTHADTCSGVPQAQVCPCMFRPGESLTADGSQMHENSLAALTSHSHRHTHTHRQSHSA